MKRSPAILSLLLVFTYIGYSQSIKTDELLAKHLESIGTDKARGTGTNISIVGDVVFSLARQAARPQSGKSVFASEGNKELFAMTFPIPTYPMEKILFDGKDVSIGSPIAGNRSVFGAYLFDNPLLLKGGLFGGVLNKGWALNDLAGRGARLSPDGGKKIDGRDTYAFNYDLKKGSGVKIRMYFDKETFHHVRTEYSRTFAAPIGATPEQSSQQVESYQNMVEDFSDFKTENGLTIPRGYKISLNFSIKGELKEYWYTFKFSDVYYDQKLDAATFQNN